MSQKLQTPEGKQCYAKRKGIVEPVFGQLKGVRGFRQFLALPQNLWVSGAAHGRPTRSGRVALVGRG
jgi:hypothetical protein